MKEVITLILLLFQNAFTVHVTSENIQFRTTSSNLRSSSSSAKIHRQTPVHPTTPSVKSDNWQVGIMQKLHALQTKVNEILDCCRSRCPGKNNSVRELIAKTSDSTHLHMRPGHAAKTYSGAIANDWNIFREAKTMKMVLPVRQCIPCPCTTAPTTCPVVPFDHCPCNVKVGMFSAKNRRRKRQMAEVIVPVDDKAAIEYLRKLGYVEEFNLFANICHSANSPADDKRTAAMVPIPIQASFPLYGVPPTHQQIPIQLLSNLMPQQSAFSGISGLQPINFAPVQQQQQQQWMIPSGPNEQPKSKHLFTSLPNPQPQLNDDCQPAGRTKSAAAVRSKILLVTAAVIVWLKLSRQIALPECI
uniref:Uncharacterized protein n=1 Tax=Setaria digitata TaxID=48799 RepID=A0A915PCP4_9BILA